MKRKKRNKQVEIYQSIRKVWTIDPATKLKKSKKAYKRHPKHKNKEY